MIFHVHIICTQACTWQTYSGMHTYKCTETFTHHVCSWSTNTCIIYSLLLLLSSKFVSQCCYMYYALITFICVVYMYVYTVHKIVCCACYNRGILRMHTVVLLHMCVCVCWYILYIYMYMYIADYRLTQPY